VGLGPEWDRLHDLTRRCGLVDHVTFLGNVPDQSEVFGLMKSASVFVLPSIREGYGMVVAEALCCGLPVITVDHPENEARELVEDGVTGRICEPTSLALADALVEILEDKLSVPPECGLRFAWTESVLSVEQIYRKHIDPLFSEPSVSAGRVRASSKLPA
jgi:glycosyltransferase involved in cell wall biosynthesis